MALDDQRGVATEQYVEFASGTENVSPYSNTSGYSDPPSYYQTDYYPHQQLVAHHQQMADSDSHYYNSYTSGNDIGIHGYHGYGSHPPVGPAEYYQQANGLWSPGPTNPSMTQGHNVNLTHRFFSGIDLSQQTRSPQSSSTTSSSGGKPKRKRVQSHSQRKAANVRERRRMFHLNEAFDELRKRLPAFNYEKRLSRIETLRLAMTYISFMKEVSVGQDPKSVKLKPHGAELTGDSLDPSRAGSLLMAHHVFSTGDIDDSLAGEDSDCSNDELSNHSGEN